MKRIFRVACLAMLGLSIAGFATYVFAQTPPAGTPPMPADKPIVLPGGPAAPVTLPGTASDVKPAATAPVAMDDPSGATDNPSGRQEPSVSLEWVGPAAAKVGQAADYSIIVRNICSI